MRDDFSIETKRTIATRVNWICSNPECRAVTSGPQMDATKVVNIGVAAHITAAAAGGKRFNATISHADRKHPSNGIWLCQNCAKKIDDDERRFTTSLLQKWKVWAELEAATARGKSKAESSRSRPNSSGKNSARGNRLFRWRNWIYR